MMHNGFGTGFGHYGNWFCGPGAFFPGPFGLIITVLFWGLLAYLLVKLFRAIFSKDTNSNSSNLENLRRRYATGDISEEEYHRMKTELTTLHASA
jgi:putative membrane protein